MALSRKWVTACDKIGPAIDAFDDLTKTTPLEKVNAWTQAAERAARERHNDYDVMAIYDVQSTKCKSRDFIRPNVGRFYPPELTLTPRWHAWPTAVPTLQQIQLELVQTENTRHGAQMGVAAWVVLGLKLEESK